jgi:hypothetical protein
MWTAHVGIAPDLDTRPAAAHARGVGELLDLGAPRSRWFEDARGRSLKASWHPEASLVVISLWESDRCIGTFRLPVADAPELMVLLAGAVKAWAADQAAASEAKGAPKDLAQA